MATYAGDLKRFNGTDWDILKPSPAPHGHEYLWNIDDRDLKPNNLSYNRLMGYFTSLEGLTGTAGSNYQDLLVLNTYNDASGGLVNALAFDKSEMKIRYYQASQSATSWGTPKTLAYAEDVLPLSGGTLTGKLRIDSLGIDGDSLSGYTQYFTSSTNGPKVEGRYTAEDRYLKLTADDILLTATNVKVNGTAVSLVGHTHSYLPLSGGTMSGTLVANTNSGTTPFRISRTGGTSEVVDMYIDDSKFYQNYTNDETSSAIRFNLLNTDTETGGGAAANSGYVEFTQGPTGTGIKVNGTDVSMSGHTHSYLPLAGGELTGQLTVDATGIKGDSLEGYTQLFSSSTNGPKVEGRYTAEDRYLKLTADDILLTATNVKVNGTNVSLAGHTHPYLPLTGGALTGLASITQNMTDGGNAMLVPHLALKPANTTDTTGFVGMSFETSTSANYGWTYGAQRTTNGNGDLIWRNHDASATGNERMRLSDTGTLTVQEDMVVHGNLTINGTTTTLNTQTLNVSDNIIVLNNDVTATPTQNAGIEIERGTSTNTYLLWNETDDRWKFTNNGSTYYNIPISTEYTNNTGTVTSVGLSMPTGFTVTNSPVTTSGTLTVALTAGYDLLNNTTQTIAGAKTFSSTITGTTTGNLTSSSGLSASKLSGTIPTGVVQATITGAVSELISTNLTAWKVVTTDGNGKLVADAVNQADLANITGSSGNFQTQLNAKQATITGAATTIASSNLTANRVLISNSSGKVGLSVVTGTELGYLDGVTSNIQGQINAIIAEDPIIKSDIYLSISVSGGSCSYLRRLRFESPAHYHDFWMGEVVVTSAAGIATVTYPGYTAYTNVNLNASIKGDSSAGSGIDGCYIYSGASGSSTFKVVHDYSGTTNSKTINVLIIMHTAK